MPKTSRLRSWLALGASAAAIAIAAPAVAQTSDQPTQTTGPTNAGASQGGLGTSAPSAPLNPQVTNPANTATTASAAPAPTRAQAALGSSGNVIGELVVTAQRRSEAIQSVPVAVSAFSADTLKAQRLDGGNNLVLSIPNVNYSRSNFGGFNFSIRGIGQKVVSGGAEAGVSINQNNLPLAASHFADTDFYDVERVEVLRGPQGTLYGRNATGGAVNIITAQPTDTPSASATAEFGNYGDKKFTGFVNMPFTDTLSLRLAGFFLQRDGFGTNTYTGNDIDGRDLNSYRATLSWKPNDKFRAYLMYEHFEEKDSRNRVGKQLCIKDPGPTSVGGFNVTPTQQGLLSQGCQAGSLYSNAAYGTPNTLPTLGGIYTQELGLLNVDAYANHPMQNHNLHDIESSVDPIFQGKQNQIQLHMAWDVTSNLSIESITGYNHNVGYTIEDYNRLVSNQPFNATPTPGVLYNLAFGAAYPFVYGANFPGGFINDPQLGYTNRFRVYDQTDGDSNELTQEFRLTSSFKGPLNFSAGIYGTSQHVNTNYYVFFNPLTGLAQLLNSVGIGPYAIDPGGVPTAGGGHNYYDARGTSRLHSYAGFGEAYYQITDDIKLTLGFRETYNRKYQDQYPIQLFVPGAAGVGTPQRLGLAADASTGRANIDWKPHLSFTDQTLLYAGYSRGYKEGGFNTPCQTINLSSTAGGCGYPLLYQPETVDAFEIGTKNTLMGGRMVLNLTGFYYNYEGYQIATTVRKSSVNLNIDSKIYGAEFEGIWEPVHNLTLNTNLGYLHTEITDGAIVDETNLTQGDPNLVHIQDSTGEACVVNAAALAGLLAATAAQPIGGQLAAILGSSGGGSGVCGGQYGNVGNPLAGLYAYTNPNVQTAPQSNGAGAAAYTVNVGQGVGQNLKGNELPNSPRFTLAIGAQYVVDLPHDWKATIRGDYYWQDDSYARIFNAVNDQLHSYDNINATLTFENRQMGLNLQVFVKNLMNNQPITDTAVGSTSSGLFYNTFTLDPRTYGVSLTKRF